MADVAALVEQALDVARTQSPDRHPLAVVHDALLIAAFAPWPTGERLRALESMPYAEYLRSPEWQATRQRMLAIAGYRCQVCGTIDSGLDVHHNNYDCRGHEWPQDLVVLCRGCHRRFHRR